MKRRAFTGVLVLTCGLVFWACNSPSPTVDGLLASGLKAAPPTDDTRNIAPGPSRTGTVASAAKQPKIDVCHYDEEGTNRIINIAEPAVPAHVAHGDHVVGVEVCDGIDNDCDGEVDGGCCPCGDPDEWLAQLGCEVNAASYGCTDRQSQPFTSIRTQSSPNFYVLDLSAGDWISLPGEECYYYAYPRPGSGCDDSINVFRSGLTAAERQACRMAISTSQFWEQNCQVVCN